MKRHKAGKQLFRRPLNRLCKMMESRVKAASARLFFFSGGITSCKFYSVSGQNRTNNVGTRKDSRRIL